jgi:hypothetical protein
MLLSRPSCYGTCSGPYHPTPVQVELGVIQLEQVVSRGSWWEASLLEAGGHLDFNFIFSIGALKGKALLS